MSIDIDLLKAQRNFGSKVKDYRIKRGLSQFDLASLCNYEKSAISRIENGRTNITLKTALIIASNLNVSISELFNF